MDIIEARNFCFFTLRWPRAKEGKEVGAIPRVTSLTNQNKGAKISSVLIGQSNEALLAPSGLHIEMHNQYLNRNFK